MSELAENIAALGTPGTRKNKTLPASIAAPAVPARVGASGVVASGSGGAVAAGDFTLAGPKVFTSTDGIIVLSFPQSALFTVGSTTLTIPAIAKTP